jgi:phenylacetate-coenzyme A ligase PaaK-like adenylate-forming protein
MLGTALTQLRYALSLASGRRIDVGGIERLVRDCVATVEEFGPTSLEDADVLGGATLSDEARRTVDRSRLRHVAKLAFDTTPYYRDLFNHLGIQPDDYDIERLEALPTTDKAALRSMPEAFVNWRADPTFQALTSGTTGYPTSMWFSRYELDLGAALGAVASVMRLGFTPEDVVQLNISSRASLAMVNTIRGCQLIGCACFPVGLIDPDETLSRLATPVHLPGKKPQVSIITTYPTYLGLLVERARALEYRREDFGLEQILCGGEVLTTALRELAEEQFGARIIENYLMTEIFPVGGLMCRDGHLHITSEQGFSEVLSLEDHRPAQPGEIGTIVTTPFFPYRETTLLLRLVTGDVVRTVGGELTCELASLPATSPILGKASHAVRTDDGWLLTRDFLEVLDGEAEVPLPSRFVVQTTHEGLDVHVLTSAVDKEVAGRIQAGLHEAGVPVRRVHLHDGRSTMPPSIPLRVDLQEASYRQEDGQFAVGVAP